MNKEAAISETRIPNKSYFKIGEVAAIADVPAHVLRFWETEFKTIKPIRLPSGQRLYRRKDIELILEIKEYLYEKKFTIEGARRYLKSQKERQPSENSEDFRSLLAEVRRELIELRDFLASKDEK